MAAPERQLVEVVYALRDKQRVVTVEYADGLTATRAVELSGLPREFPELAAGVPDLGIYGRVVQPGHPLKPGDRVEIYRRLKADPRETRRRLRRGREHDGAPGQQQGPLSDDQPPPGGFCAAGGSWADPGPMARPGWRRRRRPPVPSRPVPSRPVLSRSVPSSRAAASRSSNSRSLPADLASRRGSPCPRRRRRRNATGRSSCRAHAGTCRRSPTDSARTDPRPSACRAGSAPGCGSCRP